MQNWNNILNYIKREMGAELNLVEMSDDEIITGIKEDVIPYFSQYSPSRNFCIVTHEHRTDSQIGSYTWNYKIPVPDDERIIDIYAAYANSAGSDDKDYDPYYDTKYSAQNITGSVSTFDYYGMIDTVIDNQYIDMMKYLRVRNTWEFTPPNIISFDLPLTKGIIEYNGEHKSLKTIRPDLYDIAFKPLCLGNAQKWIAKRRSKFSELTTPVGSIRINWEELKRDSAENLEKAQRILDTLPPDSLVVMG